MAKKENVCSSLCDLNKLYEKTSQLSYDSLKLYWFKKLFNYVISRFKWGGLPFPQREIEILLHSRGFCSFVKDKDKFIVAQCGAVGVTQFNDIFKELVYTTSVSNGRRKIYNYAQGGDAVLMRNNSLSMFTLPLINMYAELFTHNVLSLKVGLVNTRAQDILSAPDSQTAETINNWYKSLESGKSIAIVDPDNMDSLIDADGIKNLASRMPSSECLKDYISVQQNLLKLFFNDIGIKCSTDKRERLISDEVNSELELLRFNVWDMLECRKEACEEIKKVFGLNVSVELESFDIEKTERKGSDDNAVENEEVTEVDV